MKRLKNRLLVNYDRNEDELHTANLTKPSFGNVTWQQMLSVADVKGLIQFT